VPIGRVFLAEFGFPLYEAPNISDVLPTLFLVLLRLADLVPGQPVRAYFFKAACQFSITVNGAGVLSAVRTATRNRLPSVLTSQAEAFFGI